MLNYLLEKGMTYKEFVKWCDARLKDNKWLPSEAMKCSIARSTIHKKWCLKEKLWRAKFQDDIIKNVIYPYEVRMLEQKRKQDSAETEINFVEMGLDRYEVLCALYNNSHPLGMGILHYTPGNLTVDEAKTLLTQSMGYADYVKGRVIKVKLPEGSVSFSPRLYDRDNGEGAALCAVTEYANNKKQG